MVELQYRRCSFTAKAGPASELRFLRGAPGLVGAPEQPDPRARATSLVLLAELELRPWRAGDRFHPSWKRAPIALKDFLRGQKLPLEERRALPLVCSGSDVLAVCAEKAHVGKPHAEGGGDARALWIVVQDARGE